MFTKIVVEVRNESNALQGIYEFTVEHWGTEACARAAAEMLAQSFRDEDQYVWIGEE